MPKQSPPNVRTAKTGAEANKQRLTEKHKSYDELHEKWRNYLDAFEGTGGFKDGSELLMHNDGEAVEDYEQRKDHAYYINLTKRVLRRFINSLLKMPIQRSVPNGSGFISRTREERLRAFEFNCVRPTTNRLQPKRSWDSRLKQRLMPSAAVYGHDNIFVWGTTAEQVRQGFFPKVFTIRLSPLVVWNWQTNGDGEYESVVWIEPLVEQTKPLEESGGQKLPKDLGVYRFWECTRSELRCYEMDGSEADFSPVRNDIGEVPFVRLIPEHSEVFPELGLSWVGDLYRVQKRIFNLCSEMTQLEREQAFSMPVMEGDADREGIAEFDDDDATATGRRYMRDGPGYAMLIPPGTTIPPYYLSPDAQHLVVLQERLKMLTAEMFRMMDLDGGVAQQVRQVVGAASKQFDIEDEATRLNDIMDSVVEFDNRVQYFRSRLEGDPDGWTGQCTHPRTFGINSLEEDLAEIQMMQQAYIPEEIIKYKVLLMVKKHFFNVDDAQKQAFKEAIQNADLKLPELEPMAALPPAQ